jgi:hypothetical protein
LEDPSIDGIIILRWIFRKWDMGAWIGPTWLMIRAGSGNETWGSIKHGEFLDKLRNG